jgi:hypothetical protein
VRSFQGHFKEDPNGFNEIKDIAHRYIIKNKDPIIWSMFKSLSKRKAERRIQDLKKRWGVLGLMAEKKGKNSKKLLTRDLWEFYLSTNEQNILWQQTERTPGRNTNAPILTKKDKEFYGILGSFSMPCYPHEVKKENRIYLQKDNDKDAPLKAMDYKRLKQATTVTEREKFFEQIHTNKRIIRNAVLHYNHQVANSRTNLSNRQVNIHTLSDNAAGKRNKPTAEDSNAEAGNHSDDDQFHQDDAAAKRKNRKRQPTHEESSNEESNAEEAANHSDNDQLHQEKRHGKSDDAAALRKNRKRQPIPEESSNEESNAEEAANHSDNDHQENRNNRNSKSQPTPQEYQPPFYNQLYSDEDPFGGDVDVQQQEQQQTPPRKTQPQQELEPRRLFGKTAATTPPATTPRATTPPATTPPATTPPATRVTLLPIDTTDDDSNSEPEVRLQKNKKKRSKRKRSEGGKQKKSQKKVRDSDSETDFETTETDGEEGLQDTAVPYEDESNADDNYSTQGRYLLHIKLFVIFLPCIITVCRVLKKFLESYDCTFLYS